MGSNQSTTPKVFPTARPGQEIASTNVNSQARSRASSDSDLSFLRRNSDPTASKLRSFHSHQHNN